MHGWSEGWEESWDIHTDDQFLQHPSGKEDGQTSVESCPFPHSSLNFCRGGPVTFTATQRTNEHNRGGLEALEKA